ncbi:MULTISPECIES: ABC transporter permease [unclassified Nocardia]|uniref:ABC transporter permease n=1 Tax=unclassified Nocardia TaxID=2637762 RepID=UPI0024A96683|nr:MULTISPECIES: ABC transporter permease [unclassified Nocardia]
MSAPWDRLRLFTVREFTVHWGRTLATVAVVAVSAAFLVAVFAISGSVTGSMQRLTAGLAGTADLEVSGVTDAGFAQSLRDEVAAAPGVAAAVPLLRANLPVDGERVLLLGMDGSGAALGGELSGAVADDVVGSLLGVSNGVLVGPDLGYAKNDVFELGSVRVTVAAVLADAESGRFNGGHYVVAPLPLAQRIAGRTGQLDSIMIVAAPDADAGALRAAVAAVVAGRAIVAEPMARAADTGNGVLMLRFMAAMGAGIAFVVSAFLVYNTMSMALAQRRPAISMLRAIGGGKRTIVRDTLAEAAVVGLAGGAVGGLLGILAGRWAIGLLPPAVTQLVEVRLEYILPGYAVPVAITAAVLTSVGASAVAARQVYRVAPVEALAPVGVSRADAGSGWTRFAAAVAVVALTAATLLVVRAQLGVFSAVALGFAFGAQIALAFLLTGPIVAATAAVARRGGGAGVLAAVNIERAPRRVWATLMTVTIAVGMTVTITGANDDAVRGARDSLASLGDSELWVSPTPEDQTPTDLLPPEVAERVAAVPGVARMTEGQLAFAAFGGTKALLYGVAPGSNYPMFRALRAEVGQRLLAGEGLVLSRSLAGRLGVTAGDAVTLRTPSGEKRAEVLDTVSYFSALAGTVAMSLDLMRDWFDRPGSTTLQIDAAPGADLEQLRSDLRTAAGPRVFVYSGREALDGISASMTQAMALARAILVITALIAATALLNTLMLALLERRRELGILRAVGSTRRFALRMILTEAAAIGVVGAALGLVFGLIEQFLYAAIATDLLGIEITARPGPLLPVFVAAALALSLLGSIPPALRAARLNIVDAVAAD